MTSEFGGFAYRDDDAGLARHISFRRWRIDSAVVSLHAWEGEDDELAYDDRSGHTHVVGPIEAWIIRRLMAEPLGVAEIASLFAEGLGREPDAELVGHVQAILERLEEQALAERTLL